MKVTVQLEYDTNTGSFKVSATANKKIRRDVLYTMLGRLQETLMAQAMEERFALLEGTHPYTQPEKSNLVIVPSTALPPTRPE